MCQHLCHLRHTLRVWHIVDMSSTLTGAILIVALAVSVYTDMRYAKIYNKIVLPCIPLGILIMGVFHGWQGVVTSLQGIAIGAIALVMAGVFGWIAPGDAKLLVAVGALRGPMFAASTLVYGALFGGAIALIILARKRVLRQWATDTAVAWSAHLPLSEAWANRAGYMPYSLAIAAGALVAALWPLL